MKFCLIKTFCLLSSIVLFAKHTCFLLWLKWSKNLMMKKILHMRMKMRPSQSQTHCLKQNLSDLFVYELWKLQVTHDSTSWTPRFSFSTIAHPCQFLVNKCLLALVPYQENINPKTFLECLNATHRSTIFN